MGEVMASGVVVEIGDEFCFHTDRDRAGRHHSAFQAELDFPTEGPAGKPPRIHLRGSRSNEPCLGATSFDVVLRMANLELDPVLGGREQEHVQVLKGVVVVTIACLYPAQLRQFLSRSADSHFADFVRPQGHDEKVVPVEGL